ncbi:hypothetical protein C4D60_Mb06t32020 [Musa balbisiana]|uniref:Galectin domain-containing protein n=1 Tax=Musa balbisiana TaxID=52838 RepID=A0A4S8IUN4_MUSBA|nr:hypothetical protein C4D60_Mb06t32020 [Musa balbisiana]
MKRSKSVESLHGRRWRLSHLLLVAAALYLFFIAFKFRHFLEVPYVVSDDGSVSGGLDRPLDGVADVGRSLFGSAYHGDAHQRKLEDGRTLDAPRVPRGKDPLVLRARQSRSFDEGYGRITGEIMKRYLRGGGRQRRGNFSVLEGMAQEAWALGLKAWEELENYRSGTEMIPATVVRIKPESCPSSVTGPETVAGIDGFIKCEKWEHVDSVDSKETKTTSWLKRFVGRAKKPEMTWPFPFAEGKLFVLTIQAGVEGYHIYVGGRHVSSFPYRMGFTLEDATGLTIKGDVDIHSVYATSLPTSHPSFSAQHVLEMSERWKSPPLPKNPVQLFVGIISATGHFAERMAVRKTWMQYPALHSSSAVAHFFVALSPKKELNAALKREAEYFKDIVILPFMDHYDLVVLKTIAICEFGVHNLTAAYIMKCDDDTFVRVDVILRMIETDASNTSLYMGNLNVLHRPLRSGKWAVTYEEWPEEIYPPYADGPGYIISNDIARYVVSQHANHSLRLFKMEDVSMGMWVEEFNTTTTTTVQYSHSWKFCQSGCMENYFTAHYQSPRQMICLWEKLSHGRAQCCNFR